MKNQEFLVDLCRKLEDNLKFSNNNYKVEFKNYSLSLYDGKHDKFYSEVWVNGKCIFRQSYFTSIEKKESPEIIYEVINKRLLQEVFNYGIMASKNQMDNLVTEI